MADEQSGQLGPSSSEQFTVLAKKACQKKTRAGKF